MSDTFNFSVEQVKHIREATGCSMERAKLAARGANIETAIKEARTLEELKLPLLALTTDLYLGLT